MTLERVAHRYAIAIYGSAREANQLDRLSADFQMIERALITSRDLYLFFKSPILSRDLKLNAIKELLSNNVSAYTIDVILFLINSQREHILKEIIDAFFIEKRKQENIQLALVTSAIELSDTQKNKLRDTLYAVTKKQIEVGYQVDTNIRGGLSIRMDDTVYDGSITHQLDLIRKRFTEGIAA